MNPTLKTLALKTLTLLAAIALPAAILAAGSASAGAAGSALVTGGALAAPVQTEAGVQLVRHSIPPVLTDHRCLASKYAIYKKERNRLKVRGYRKIKYTGFRQYRRSCLQVIRFTACRGALKYRFIIRYKNARLLHIGRYRTGLCLTLPRKLKSAS